MLTISNHLMDKHAITNGVRIQTFFTSTLVIMQTNRLFLEELYLPGYNATEPTESQLTFWKRHVSSIFRIKEEAR
jgi:hypothetical protein